MATQIFSANYHSRRPNMNITLSYDVSRVGGEQSSSMSYTFYADLYCKPGEIYASSNSTGITISIDGTSHTFYCIGQGTASTTGPWTSSNRISFNTTNTSTNGSTGISVYVWCHQGTYANPTGTSFNCTATGGPYDYSWSGNISVPIYNPYSPPSVSCSSLTPISRIDDGTWTVKYHVNGPVGASITDIGLDVIRNVNGQDTTLEYFSFGGGAGDRTNTFTIHSGSNRTDGLDFNTRLYVNDSSSNSVHSSPWVLTRTYRIPIVQNVKIGSSLFSPQDLTKLSWTTNSRTWPTYEDEFYTKLSGDAETSASDQSPKNASNNGSTFTSAISETMTKNILNQIFNNSSRSASVMKKDVTVKRGSNSGNYLVSGKVSISVQYQPSKQPLNGTVTDLTGKSVQGNTIFIQDTPNINIDWTYPISSGAAGVVNGYILRVYDSNTYTNQVGENINVSITENATSSTYKLNTKTQLKRGVMNYIKITPYYTKPDGTGNIEGTQSLQMQLVLPLSRLDTPVIQYPISSSIWHNKNFRILLTLPADDDFSIIGLTEENYRYQDIELKITPSVSTQTVTYTFKKNPNIFSTDVLSYMKKICINPSIILTLPTSNTYKLEIRVQKNYFVTSGEYSYSKWSNPVILNVQAVNKLNLSVGTEITANQYKYVRDASIRLYNTYPIIQPLPKNNVEQLVGNQIDYTEYQGISDTILNIYKGVNTFCDYDVENVKFEQSIESLAAKQELITSNNVDDDLNGRNYKNILIDDMNKLI